MMKLGGHNYWVSWFHQAKELVSGITSEISKVQLIYNSLSNQEDRKHLAGLTSFSEIMKYLRQKYHKPAEVASSILARGHRLTHAGDNLQKSKSNMLILLEVRRDLSKFGMKSRIDIFYINTVAPKVFTNTEYQRYVREEEAMENEFQETLRKAAIKKSKLASSTKFEEELDSAARARGLSEDEASDAESDCTAAYSFVTHSKLPEEDGSQRARRFFYKFIDSCMTHIRRMESASALFGGPTGEDKNKKDQKQKMPKTLMFCTGTGASKDDKCWLSECGKIHQNPKTKKPVKSLLYCPYFTKLKEDDKRKIARGTELCTRCLNVGHRQKNCDSTISCQNCGSETHHKVMCRVKKSENKSRNVEYNSASALH